MEGEERGAELLSHPYVQRLMGRYAVAEAGRIEAQLQVERLSEELTKDRRLKSMLHGDAMKARMEHLLDEHEIVVGGLIDLDCFKSVNDGWGHDVGNILLDRLEEVLQPRLRRKDESFFRVLLDSIRPRGSKIPKTDSIARMGGDEFAIALTVNLNNSDQHSPERRTQRLGKKIKKLEKHLRSAESVWLDDEEHGIRKLLRETPLLKDEEENDKLTPEQKEAVIAGIGFSLGFASYDARGDLYNTRLPSKTIVNELVMQMDTMMYRDKSKRHARLRDTHPAIDEISKRR